MGKTYFVYILMNSTNKVLYVGVSNSLSRRLDQHRSQFTQSFTKKYNINKLVYYEVYDDINYAIRREKLIKRWKRQWKENIIKEMNPSYSDLSIDLPLSY
ncbi:MAG: GIY-YIG nuclease family protein [Candidatus Dojkabacteria bacterium]